MSSTRNQIQSYVICQPVLKTCVSSREPTPFTFQLSCKFTTISRRMLRYGNSREFLNSIHPSPLVSTTVPMSLLDFHCYEKAFTIIEESIKNWPIPSQDQADFINLTLGHAADAFTSMKADDTHIYIHMHMTARLYEVFEETREEVRMVPTEESTIESLKTVEMVSGSCSVCLEEFSKGSKGVPLPCSHVFHEDCIKKWLRVSHFCPNCRFEMPTI